MRLIFLLIVLIQLVCNGQSIPRSLGNKSYEVSNHLGNVMTVVSDRKTPTPETPNTIIAYNETDIKSYNDYYPYGMVLNGRNKDKNYRYGFNGHEKDKEFYKSNSVSYDFGARVYNNRISRFSSMDPWSNKYHWQSTYSYHKNTPINSIDWKGFGDEPSNDKPTKIMNPDGKFFNVFASKVRKFKNVVCNCTENGSPVDPSEAPSVIKNSVRSFEFNGQWFNATWGSKQNGDGTKFIYFKGYKNSSGKYYNEYLEEYNEGKRQAVLTVTNILVSNEGLIYTAKISGNPLLLWNDKTFQFTVKPDSFNTDEYNKNIGSSLSTELSGFIFYKDRFQDMEKYLTNLTIQTGSSGLGHGYLSLGSSYLKAMKDDQVTRVVFYLMNFNAGGGVSIGPNVTPFSISRGKTHNVNVEALTKPNIDDSTRMGLR